MDELLSPDGETVKSPAETLYEQGERARSARELFLTTAQRLIATLPEASRAKANKFKTAGENTGKHVLTLRRIDDYEAQLQDYIDELEKLAQTAGSDTAGLQLAGAALTARRAEGSVPRQGVPVVSVREAARLSLGGGLVIVAAGLVMVVAVAAVLAAQYVSNYTFGTGTDYLKLFLAAFGSAQVAVILTALLAARGRASTRPAETGSRVSGGTTHWECCATHGRRASRVKATIIVHRPPPPLNKTPVGISIGDEAGDLIAGSGLRGPAHAAVGPVVPAMVRTYQARVVAPAACPPASMWAAITTGTRPQFFEALSIGRRGAASVVAGAVRANVALRPDAQVG